jgi:glycosyltransferase involved in cell wall biosynthesis
MHILHVSNYFRDTHEHVGGAEQACYRIARLARVNGYDVSVAATRPDGSGRSEFPTYTLPIVEDYLPDVLKRYVEVLKWYSIQADPLASRTFGKVLRAHNVDIVHFHNFQFLTLSLIATARDFEKKTIVSIYDYWLFCPTVMLADPAQRFCTRAHGPWCAACLPRRMRSVQRLLLSFRRRLFDRYLRRVDGFHVLSEHSRSVLEGYGIERSRIHVVPLTLPIEYLDEPEQDVQIDPDMIFFAGWRNERKGLHRLLEAMPKVVEAHPAAHLTVCGGKVRFGDEYEALLDGLLEKGRIRDRVTFLGHMPPSEIKRYLQQTAVIVIPEQYENMSPLLMIESMSLARPLVISRVGGVPEFVEHGVTGYMADPLDPADFAEQILAVLKDPRRAEEMGLAARKAILEKCDGEVIWKKARTMYDNVAS